MNKLRNIAIILLVLYWSKIPGLPDKVQEWAGEYDYTQESYGEWCDKEINRYAQMDSPSSKAWA